MSGEPPLAMIRRVDSRATTWAWIAFWLFALGLLAVSTYLAFATAERGTLVRIRFQDGHGLKAGDAIRHRGIQVGRITRVALAPDLDGVLVECDLDGEAAALARIGTQFWIVRPAVSLGRVEGLETIIGGRYLAVIPGPAGSASQQEFQGLEEGPLATATGTGGLELVLESERRQGMERGAPVRFRGMKVGEILTVALASDGLTVEARAIIDARYRPLVRENSVFWHDSGVDLSVGLRGFELTMGTLDTVTAGGIAFATPQLPGKPVLTGHRFYVARAPEEGWEEWRPNLLIGNETLPEGGRLPVPLRSQYRIPTRRFGIKTESRRSAWILPIGPQTVLAPSSLVFDAEGKIPSDARLEFSGRQQPLAPERIRRRGHLVELQLDEPLAADATWPAERLRMATQPEDCLVVAGPGEPTMTLSQSRLRPGEDRWEIDAAISISDGWYGAVVVSRADGHALGMIDSVDGHSFISLWCQEKQP